MARLGARGRSVRGGGIDGARGCTRRPPRRETAPSLSHVANAECGYLGSAGCFQAGRAVLSWKATRASRSFL